MHCNVEDMFFLEIWKKPGLVIKDDVDVILPMIVGFFFNFLNKQTKKHQQFLA